MTLSAQVYQGELGLIQGLRQLRTTHNLPMPYGPISPKTTGLLLTGGGARAAYQVGVLEAIADLRKAAGALDQPNPFPIITGTSAGAINAAA